MLILAGVSINAIVGEDGILSRTQYSTFLSEMTAVEEAVQMWKAGEVMGKQGEETKEIPANGLCKVDDLTATDRLTGEVGYYRIWSMSDTVPEMSVLTNADDFNNKFESEMIYYPAGVQDLFYLNNEALGIKSDKTYLIDAATGMIYSMSGVNLKGVSCYSANMATAVMSGNLNAPVFAESEVSGTGTDDKLAGNTEHEYGFQIITNSYTNNLYKLYNSGDLYAKGIKGTQLNTSTKYMEAISANKFVKIEIPSEIGGYKKVFVGQGTVYVIDNSDDLWAWGSNGGNKLALTQEQMVEFTERDPVKVNLPSGVKVNKLFDLGSQLFVVSTDDELYGMGYNISYTYLGLGHSNEIYEFQKITLPNNQSPSTIEYFSCFSEPRYGVLMACNDGHFFATASHAQYFSAYPGRSGAYSKWAPVMDGYIYTQNSDGKVVVDTSVPYNSVADIDQDVKKVVGCDAMGAAVLMKDGKLYHIGAKHNNNFANGAPNTGPCLVYSDYSTEVKDIAQLGSYGLVVLKNNGDIYARSGLGLQAGEGTASISDTLARLQLPTLNTGETIKEIQGLGNGIYILTSLGRLLGVGISGPQFGMDTPPTTVQICTTAPIINTFYDMGDWELCGLQYVGGGTATFATPNGIYTINATNITFRNNILEQSWKKIASDVLSVSLGSNNSIAYIDKNRNIYIAGDDSRMLDQNTTVATKISNFVQLNDPLINGKALQVQFSNGLMYILANSLDDKGNINGNVLYATGLYSATSGIGWPNDYAPGWTEQEHKYTLIKILENIDNFSVCGYGKLALKDNQLYMWGNSATGQYGGVRVPAVRDISSTVDASKIKILHCSSGGNGIDTLVTEDGKIYVYSTYNSPGPSACFDTGGVFRDISGCLQEGEKVIQVSSCNEAFEMFVTDKGNLYGWGNGYYLGLGSAENKKYLTPQLLLTNVSQVSCGNGYSVAIKKDGTVWGTGTNFYGVLGRWIGVDRKQPNSRYKTAFEWVECPELEI